MALDLGFRFQDLASLIKHEKGEALERDQQPTRARERETVISVIVVRKFKWCYSAATGDILLSCP